MATRFMYANMKEHLLLTAMEVSPTGKEREAFGKIVQNMDKAHESDKDICITLMQSMLDGLRYDNWPDPERIV